MWGNMHDMDDGAPMMLSCPELLILHVGIESDFSLLSLLDDFNGTAI